MSSGNLLMRAKPKWGLGTLIIVRQADHEVLPWGGQKTAIGHPSQSAGRIMPKVYGGKELGHNLRVIIPVERDHIINSKLLHQIQSLTKIGTMLILPHTIHVDPVHVHIYVLLSLDHIQINEILLLSPEQIIPSEVGMMIHTGVDLPSSDKLRKRYLIHAHGGLLELGGGGLGPALGGIGAL